MLLLDLRLLRVSAITGYILRCSLIKPARESHGLIVSCTSTIASRRWKSASHAWLSWRIPLRRIADRNSQLGMCLIIDHMDSSIKISKGLPCGLSHGAQPFHASRFTCRRALLENGMQAEGNWAINSAIPLHCMTMS
jgi:hypothetical protein